MQSTADRSVARCHAAWAGRHEAVLSSARLNSAILSVPAILAALDRAPRGTRGSKRRQQPLAVRQLQARSCPSHYLASISSCEQRLTSHRGAMAGNKLAPAKRKSNGALVGGQRRLSDMGVTVAVSGIVGALLAGCRHLPPAACRGLAPAAPTPCPSAS